MSLVRPRRTDDGSSPPGGALSAAVRDALQFDRRAISLQGGLLAAIPVVAVLALGTAVWSSVAGVTMGAGAMLVGIAWRVAGGRPPLALLATDATVMATSTFVGCLTGSIPWLHFGLLAVWALAGGLLVALGNRGGVIGTQAMIAFVVFGRFSQPAAASLALAGLVLAGGFAQVVFQAVVRWPTPLRWQRAATANAYRALARLARGSAETSTLPIAQALDEAQASLSSLTLFGEALSRRLAALAGQLRAVGSLAVTAFGPAAVRDHRQVARSLSEPATRRIDAEQSQGSLAAARRLVLAAHVLRLDAQEERGRRPLPALEPLAADLDRLLGTVDATLRVGPDGPVPAAVLPDLRADYEQLERAAPKDPDSAAVLIEVDEIVDAANGLAALAGLETIDGEDGRRAGDGGATNS